jgi:hypothetical protein
MMLLLLLLSLDAAAVSSDELVSSSDSICFSGGPFPLLLLLLLLLRLPFDRKRRHCLVEREQVMTKQKDQRAKTVVKHQEPVYLLCVVVLDAIYDCVNYQPAQPKGVGKEKSTGMYCEDLLPDGQHANYSGSNGMPAALSAISAYQKGACMTKLP